MALLSRPGPIADASHRLRNGLAAMASTHERLQAELVDLVLGEGGREARIVLRALIDTMPDKVFVKDRQSRFVIANRAVATGFGMDDPEEVVGLTDLDIFPPELGLGFFEHEQAIMASGQSMLDCEEHYIDGFGAECWFSSTKIPFRNAAGQIVGIIGVNRDISERKVAELVRVEQANILEMIARNEPLDAVLLRLIHLVEAQIVGIVGSVLLMDEDGVHLRAGAAPNLPADYVAAVDGVAIGEGVGSCGTAAARRQPVIVTDIAKDSLWRDYAGLAESFGLGACWSMPVLSRTGEVLGTFAMYSPMPRCPLTQEISFIEVIVKIAGIAIHSRQSEDRIEYMAHRDGLTGVSNRTHFSQILDGLFAMKDVAGTSAGIGLLMVDIDHLKEVNDTLGHEAGDCLIRTVAERLGRIVGPSGSIARLGGDEFVILLVDETIAVRLEAVSRAVIEAMQERLTVLEQTILPQVSIGGAVAAADETAETLRQKADLALYEAKRSCRGGYVAFHEDLRISTLNRISLVRQVEAALADGRVEPFYQPIVNPGTGEIVGLEALARMRTEWGEILSADAFQVIFNNHRVARALTWRMLNRVAADIRAWLDGGIRVRHVGINVSTADFRNGDLHRRITEVFAAHDVPLRHVILEVTETVFMGGADNSVARAIENLRREGLRVALDDFGTGHASLTHLVSVPTDIVKIDRSFVARMLEEPASMAIVETMIDLAGRLGIHVVAEGVETRAQADHLRQAGCELCQGYYFGRPADGPTTEVLLRRNARDHVEGNAASLEPAGT